MRCLMVRSQAARSTWFEATQVAIDARVKHLILFHHDPSHDDEMVNNLVLQARRHFENTDAAREGWRLSQYWDKKRFRPL